MVQTDWLIPCRGGMALGHYGIAIPSRYTDIGLFKPYVAISKRRSVVPDPAQVAIALGRHRWISHFQHLLTNLIPEKRSVPGRERWLPLDREVHIQLPKRGDHVRYPVDFYDVVPLETV